MDIPFHSTIMGRRFIEGTIPQAVDSLNTLNSRISVLAGQIDRMEATISRLTELLERIEGDTRPSSEKNRGEMEPMSSR